jgi:hypothetical protein
MIEWPWAATMRRAGKNKSDLSYYNNTSERQIMKKILTIASLCGLMAVPLSAQSEKHTQVTALEYGGATTQVVSAGDLPPHLQATPVPATINTPLSTSGSAKSIVESGSSDKPMDLRLLLPQLEQLKAAVNRAGGTLDLQINGIAVEELFIPLQSSPGFKVTMVGNEMVVRPAEESLVSDIEQQRARLRQLIRDNAMLEKKAQEK